MSGVLLLNVLCPSFFCARKTESQRVIRAPLCVPSLYIQVKVKQKLKKNILHFCWARSQVNWLTLTPIETVCQSHHASSQTGPGVDCCCATSTMLHCSLRMAYLPQRGTGFNKENHEVRRSPLLKNEAEDFMRRRWAFLCDAWTWLWRGEKFPMTVFCLWQGLNWICAQYWNLRLQIWILPQGGFTHLCHSRVISSHNTCFSVILCLKHKYEIFSKHVAECSLLLWV